MSCLGNSESEPHVSYSGSISKRASVRFASVVVQSFSLDHASFPANDDTGLKLVINIPVLANGAH